MLKDNEHIQDRVDCTTEVSGAVTRDDHRSQTRFRAEGRDEGGCNCSKSGKAEYCCNSMPTLLVSMRRYVPSDGDAHGNVNVKTPWARVPTGIVVNTVLTDLEIRVLSLVY